MFPGINYLRAGLVGSCYHDRYETVGSITEKLFAVFKIYEENKESP
jgi:hypothetical protein